MRRPTHDAALLFTLLATVTTLGAGCSPDQEDHTPGTAEGLGAGRRWTARLELPTRGHPEVVGIRDLTGDGHAQLWALTRAARTGSTGELLSSLEGIGRTGRRR